MNIVAPAAPNAFGGDVVHLTFNVRGADNQPAVNTAVHFSVSSGDLTTSDVHTDASGAAVAEWKVADVDATQIITANAGGKKASVSLIAAAKLEHLQVDLGSIPVLAGDSVGIKVTGRSASGRIVPVTAVTVQLSNEARAFADLPVAIQSGNYLRASGPGTIEVHATVAGVSGQSTFTVNAGRPIILNAAPASLPGEGGVVQVRGYDLDKLVAGSLSVDAHPVAFSGSSTLITVYVPARMECSGRAVSDLSAAGAYLPNGPLRIERPTPSMLRMSVGSVLRLGQSSNLCLQFAAQKDAEYELAMLDARPIESSRNVAEDLTLTTQPWSISGGDRSLTQNSTGAAYATSTRSPTPATSDIRIQPTVSSLQDDPGLDYYGDRDTPWRVGDAFSVDSFAPTGRFFQHGRIFYSTARFAVGIFDSDAHYQIPNRIRDLESTIDQFMKFGAPFLTNVLAPEWPTTTDASQQTLIVICDAGGYGGLTAITANSNNKLYVMINLGQSQVPLSEPLYFNPSSLFHEMTHAWQDRFLIDRCRDEADCGVEPWSYKWAVEGGAELLKEEMMARAAAFDRNGDYDLHVVANIFGFVFSYVNGHALYSYVSGYTAASVLLRDYVNRLIAAGVPVDDAFSAVAKGALEGWYGKMGDAAVRPGLTARMTDVSGSSWDPVDATLRAVLSIAADNRWTGPELQVPFSADMWNMLLPAYTFDLGQGPLVSGSGYGPVFAHFRITDSLGAGGSVRLEYTGATPEWAIVRIK